MLAVGLAAWTGHAAGMDARPADSLREANFAPVAFRPANAPSHHTVEKGGLGRLCTTKGAAYFVAPVQLEDGAVVEEVTVFLEDESHESLGMMSLVRRQLQDFDILALTPISVGTGEVETLTTTEITAPVVDNHDAAYLLQVMLSGPGVCLYGARVRFRSPAVRSEKP
jgi:hypothetical protein